MRRFKLWKDWYKHCTNNSVYKFLVLIGLAHSPSFEVYEDILKQIEQEPNLELQFITDEKK